MWPFGPKTLQSALLTVKNDVAVCVYQYVHLNVRNSYWVLFLCDQVTGNNNNNLQWIMPQWIVPIFFINTLVNTSSSFLNRKSQL